MRPSLLPKRCVLPVALLLGVLSGPSAQSSVVVGADAPGEKEGEERRPRRTRSSSSSGGEERLRGRGGGSSSSAAYSSSGKKSPPLGVPLRAHRALAPKGKETTDCSTCTPAECTCPDGNYVIYGCEGCPFDICPDTSKACVPTHLDANADVGRLCAGSNQALMWSRAVVGTALYSDAFETSEDIYHDKTPTVKYIKNDGTTEVQYRLASSTAILGVNSIGSSSSTVETSTAVLYSWSGTVANGGPQSEAPDTDTPVELSLVCQSKFPDAADDAVCVVYEGIPACADLPPPSSPGGGAAAPSSRCVGEGEVFTPEMCADSTETCYGDYDCNSPKTCPLTTYNADACKEVKYACDGLTSEPFEATWYPSKCGAVIDGDLVCDNQNNCTSTPVMDGTYVCSYTTDEPAGGCPPGYTCRTECAGVPPYFP